MIGVELVLFPGMLEILLPFFPPKNLSKWNRTTAAEQASSSHPERASERAWGWSCDAAAE